MTVQGPSEAKLECIDNGDSTCTVNYLPTEPGEYKINILYADEHIPGSPFTGKLFYGQYAAVKVWLPLILILDKNVKILQQFKCYKIIFNDSDTYFKNRFCIS